MSKYHSTILGLDPGSTHLGVAVVRDTDLVYYAVKSLKRYLTPAESYRHLKRVVSTLTQEFDVSIISLERLRSVRKGRTPIAAVYQHLKLIAEQSGLPLREYSSRSARERICGKTGATKKDGYSLLGSRYAELGRYSSGARPWTRAYYAHILDAITVALAASEDQGSNHEEPFKCP